MAAAREYGHSGVLVDTSVWSLALRRKSANLNPAEKQIKETLAALVQAGHARLTGVIRQEVLSGICEESVFNKIRDQLRAFDEPQLEVTDYEEAARMNNTCRSRGVAGSPIDLLICAIALRRNWEIFTRDEDFERYRRIVGIALYAGP